MLSPMYRWRYISYDVNKKTSLGEVESLLNRETSLGRILVTSYSISDSKERFIFKEKVKV